VVVVVEMKGDEIIPQGTSDVERLSVQVIRGLRASPGSSDIP
jgi:hypothetical protein